MERRLLTVLTLCKQAAGSQVGHRAARPALQAVAHAGLQAGRAAVWVSRHFKFITEC